MRRCSVNRVIGRVLGCGRTDRLVKGDAHIRAARICDYGNDHRTVSVPEVAQLGVAALLFPAVDAHATTEPWQDVRRAALAADLDHSRPQLAEDSGILVANGIEPVVDDLFLWTRLVRLGLVTDTVTPRVERGEFASIIADVDLEQLDQATVFEQQRWRPALVDAILRHYALAVAVPGHYRYVPR